MIRLDDNYIESNFVQQQSRGVKCVCCECGGNNLWITTDNNRGFCFECGTAFYVGATRQEHAVMKLYDYDSVRNIYTKVNPIYQSALSDQAKLYLANRGIDNSMQELYQLGECPSLFVSDYNEPIALDAGLIDQYRHIALESRITFPYIDGGKVTDLRGRTMTGEEPKYRSVRNPAYARGALYPYNWERAFAKASETKTLIITEGEIKAMIADAHGFACTAMPGMVAWRSGLQVPFDWKVVALFDSSSDSKDRWRVSKATTKLYERMPNLRVAQLPLLGYDKMDIDFFLLHVKNAVAKMKDYIDNALSYKDYMQLRRF